MVFRVSFNRTIVEKAIETALAAKPAWEAMAFTDRAAIFLKAADLLATKYRVSPSSLTFPVSDDGCNHARTGKECLVRFFISNTKIGKQISIALQN